VLTSKLKTAIARRFALFLVRFAKQLRPLRPNFHSLRLQTQLLPVAAGIDYPYYNNLIFGFVNYVVGDIIFHNALPIPAFSQLRLVAKFRALFGHELQTFECAKYFIDELCRRGVITQLERDIKKYFIQIMPSLRQNLK